MKGENVWVSLVQRHKHNSLPGFLFYSKAVIPKYAQVVYLITPIKKLSFGPAIFLFELVATCSDHLRIF